VHSQELSEAYRRSIVSIRKVEIRCSVLLGLALALSPMAFAQQNAGQAAGQPVARPIQGRGTPIKNTPNSVWRSPTPDNSPFDPHNLNGNWEGVVRNTTGKEVSAFTPAGKLQFDANKPLNACAGYNDPKNDCPASSWGSRKPTTPTSIAIRWASRACSSTKCGTWK